MFDHDIFGARDVEVSAWKYEVRLDIHFPEDRLRRDRGHLRAFTCAPF